MFDGTYKLYIGICKKIVDDLYGRATFYLDFPCEARSTPHASCFRAQNEVLRGNVFFF